MKIISTLFSFRTAAVLCAAAYLVALWSIDKGIPDTTAMLLEADYKDRMEHLYAAK